MFVLLLIGPTSCLLPSIPLLKAYPKATPLTIAIASASTYIAIPGPDAAHTLDNLEKSRLAYNGLPVDHDQPIVVDAVLADLQGLLEKYNVKEKFGYHLVHGYLQVAPGRVMLGQPMTKLDACWTRSISVEEVALWDVHGHVFVLGADGQFTPYEYRQGPPPQIAANESAFISTLQSYLVQRNLGSLIGIQLLGGDGTTKDLQEFVLSDNHGTVIMDANMTNANKAYRVTDWTLVRNVNGTTELKGNEQNAETVKGPHKVFIDGKGLPDIGGGVDAVIDIDEEIVIDALRREEVIN